MCYCPITILECGDIEKNPGPGFDRQSRKKHNATTKKSASKKALSIKCSVCNKGVGNNRKRLSCGCWLELMHVTCSNLTTEMKSKIKLTALINWTRTSCLFNELSFKNCRTISETSESFEPKTYTDSTKCLSSFSMINPPSK